MTERTSLFGAIEAGGTKFVCAIGDSTGRLLDEARISTRDPTATLADVFAYFHETQRRLGPLQAVGLASFGPLDINPASARYGYMLKTPKVGWSDFDFRGALMRELGTPVGFDTDVNAAGLAEHRWGAGIGLPSLVYVTVGTGIGAGVIYKGAAMVGVTHPEVGHIYLRRHPMDESFVGTCPFHWDCLEGVASGPSIVARSGRSLQEAPADDAIWDIEADYLGQLCAYLVMTYAPYRILLGGGVMQQERLFPLIRTRMRHWLAGYSQQDEVLSDAFIQPPALRGQAGVKGALALAIEAAKDAPQDRPMDS